MIIVFFFSKWKYNTWYRYIKKIISDKINLSRVNQQDYFFHLCVKLKIMLKHILLLCVCVCACEWVSVIARIQRLLNPFHTVYLLIVMMQ